MSEPLILAIDVGTQSVRAILFDKCGNLVGKKKVPFVPYYSKEFGYAEQDPDLYFNKIVEAINGLYTNNDNVWDDIIGISITTIRDCFVNLDKDMKPIRDTILWMDRRESSLEGLFTKKTKFLYKLVGMYEVAKKNGTGIKSNWLIENESENWAKTVKYASISAYINYRVAGRLVDSVASCIGHMPFDYKKKQWFTEKHLQRPMYKMSMDLTYDLVNPGDIIGNITKEFAELTHLKEGLPLIASGSDKGTETVGVGAVREDIAALSFGTTATVQLTTKKFVEPITFLPAYPAVYPGAFNPEIQIYRGYWMIAWYIEQFGAPEIEEAKKLGITTEQHLDRYLTEIPPGAEGLVVSPFWGAGLKYPYDRGAIVGFTESHTRGHVYKAIIEGINFALMQGLKRLERKTGVKVKTLRVSGGGTSSNIVCQLTADMFGIPVVRVQTSETSGLGAAICGFVGMGVYDNFEDAITAMSHAQIPFIPDPEKAEKYARIYKKLYKKVPKALRPLYVKKDGKKLPFE